MNISANFFDSYDELMMKYKHVITRMQQMDLMIEVRFNTDLQ